MCLVKPVIEEFIYNLQLSGWKNIYCKAAVNFFKMQIGVLKACFKKKRKKAPIELVKNYLVVYCSLLQFIGSIIKENDNKNWKGKQISRG